VSERVFELLLFHVPAYTVCPFTSSVPFVRVMVFAVEPAPVPHAPVNCQFPFDVALNVALPVTLPAKSTVCVVDEVDTKLIADDVELPAL